MVARPFILNPRRQYLYLRQRPRIKRTAIPYQVMTTGTMIKRENRNTPPKLLVTHFQQDLIQHNVRISQTQLIPIPNPEPHPPPPHSIHLTVPQTSPHTNFLTTSDTNLTSASSSLKNGTMPTFQPSHIPFHMRPFQKHILCLRREGVIFGRVEIDAAAVVGVVAVEDRAGGFGEDT